jgi:hypothetical protein
MTIQHSVAGREVNPVKHAVTNLGQVADDLLLAIRIAVMPAFEQPLRPAVSSLVGPGRFDEARERLPETEGLRSYDDLAAYVAERDTDVDE